MTARKPKAEAEVETGVPDDITEQDVLDALSEDDNELDALMRQHAEEGAEIGDDEVDIDLSEAETYEPFTATVPVEITTAALKVAGQNAKVPGSKYLELKLRVFEGEYEKRVAWTNVSLTGKGAGFGIDKLEAFGAESKSGDPINKDNVKVYLPGLRGLRALAACAPDPREEYKHKLVVGKISRYVSEGEAEAENLK